MRNPFALPERPPADLPLEDFGGPHAPGTMTHESWEAAAAARWPVRFYLTRRLPQLVTRLRERLWRRPWYWLRTHTIHRYHIVDMRYPRNGYHWGWIETDHALLYASFALLTDFVENQYPGYLDWDYDERTRKARDEILSLHRWWTKERKEERDAHDEWVRSGHGRHKERAKRYADRDALDAKDLEMLHRLVTVSPHLWT